MLSGGVPAGQALGSFGDHFDIRGAIEGLATTATAKGLSIPAFHHPPLFNIGIRHALIKNVPNLAVISPASGFEGYACSAGRIVEYNCGVGQGVGIAAAMALLGNINLADFSNQDVRKVLVDTGRLPKIYGVKDSFAARNLRTFEISMRLTNAIALIPA